jgi:hypothetical protein
LEYLNFTCDEAEFIMKYNKLDFHIIGWSTSYDIFGVTHEIAYGSIPENLKFFIMTPNKLKQYKRLMKLQNLQKCNPI